MPQVSNTSWISMLTSSFILFFSLFLMLFYFSVISFKMNYWTICNYNFSFFI